MPCISPGPVLLTASKKSWSAPAGQQAQGCGQGTRNTANASPVRSSGWVHVVSIVLISIENGVDWSRQRRGVLRILRIPCRAHDKQTYRAFIEVPFCAGAHERCSRNRSEFLMEVLWIKKRGRTQTQPLSAYGSPLAPVGHAPLRLLVYFSATKLGRSGGHPGKAGVGSKN